MNEEEVSQSEEDGELDNIIPEVFPMFKNGKNRKPSYASMTNEIIIEEEPPQRVRTRSRSQGNMQFSFVEKPNYTMGEQRFGEEKVK